MSTLAPLSLTHVRSNIMEIASLALRGETDLARGLVANVASTALFDCRRSSGWFHYGVVVVVDALLLENSVADRVQIALKKTRSAFIYYLQKGREAQIAHISEEAYDKRFLFEFSSTIKAIRHLFKSPQGETFTALLASLLLEPDSPLDSLQILLDPFLLNERIIRFEALTEAKIPFSLFQRLESLSEDEKGKVKEWFLGCLTPPFRDLLSEEEAKKEALQKVNQLPKLLYTLFRFFNVPGSYFNWIVTLTSIVGDYQWDSTKFQLPSGPLPNGFEAVKSRTLFSLSLSLAEREKASPFFPLSQIRYADRCGRGVWREKLDQTDLGWVPILIRRIFEKGVMPVSSTTNRFSFVNFGVSLEGFVKAHTRQIPVRINYYQIDDFIWQAAKRNFADYVAIYQQAQIEKTPYGEVLKLIGYAVLDWEAGNIVDRAKKLKLDKAFIKGQLKGFQRIEYPHYIDEETQNKGFAEFWKKGGSWRYFPGLWYRHIPLDAPLKKYAELLESCCKGCKGCKGCTRK